MNCEICGDKKDLVGDTCSCDLLGEWEQRGLSAAQKTERVANWPNPPTFDD